MIEDNLKNKIYVIFGAGDYGKKALEMLGRENVAFFVDNDKNNQVYEYKGYSPDECIISFYYSGEMDGCMLMREINVKNIPEKLHSEYKWN